MRVEVERHAELDLGTGGAGAETVITTIRFHLGGDGSGGMSHQTLFYPLDNIANGARVSARLRSDGVTSGIRLAYTYLAKPL